ncbi:MAG TPA: TIR domain-containing protein [Ktedonobacteraceae bacterium]|jgi:hypothetical protein
MVLFKEKDQTAPLEVFRLYAREDEPLHHHQERYLSLLSRQGVMTFWHDHQILSGESWSQIIDIHLEAASVITLLISSDFLASGYRSGVGMQHAFQCHEAREAMVIPILLRSCDSRVWIPQHVEFPLPQLPTNAANVGFRLQRKSDLVTAWRKDADGSEDDWHLIASITNPLTTNLHVGIALSNAFAASVRSQLQQNSTLSAFPASRWH